MSEKVHLLLEVSRKPGSVTRYDLVGEYTTLSRPQNPAIPQITQVNGILRSYGHHFFKVDHEDKPLFFEGDGSIVVTLLHSS